MVYILQIVGKWIKYEDAAAGRRKEIEYIYQESPNYSLCQTGPPPSFVNEVLLKQSQMCHLPIVNGCFHITYITTEHLRSCGLQSLKYLLSVLLL